MGHGFHNSLVALPTKFSCGIYRQIQRRFKLGHNVGKLTCERGDGFLGLQPCGFDLPYPNWNDVNVEFG